MTTVPSLDRIRVGSAPDSWGVWFPDDPQQVPWERFLDEVAAMRQRARENETCRLRYARRATKNAVVGCQNVIDFRSFLFIEERWTARGAVPTTRKNAAEVIATSALGAHRFHIQVPNHH